MTLLGLGACAVSAPAQTIIYNGFASSAGLTLNGNAMVTAGAVPSDGTVLRLTPALYYQSGSAFSTTQVPLTSSSFSTAFSFRITGSGGIGDEDGPGADGITFTLQTFSNNTGGAGGGIGYAGIPNSVAIEFDTYNNGEISGNHVAVDTAGVLSNLFAVPVATRMNDGNLWYSWIDYDGNTHQLEVRLAQTATRPLAPIIATSTLDIAGILGQSSAYVGFTSGTGSGYGNHDIVAWQFNGRYAPIDSIDGSTGVPDTGSTALLLALGLIPLAALQVRRQRPVVRI